MTCKNSTRFPNGSRNSKREYPGIGMPSIISIFADGKFRSHRVEIVDKVCDVSF